MKCLSEDQGRSWSRIIWPKIEQIFPTSLITGLTGIMESELAHLPTFYQSIFRSYVLVNDLFYKCNPGLPIPYNLYGTSLHPKIKQPWVDVGILTTFDVPTKNRWIDLTRLQAKFEKVPIDFYLFCCSLQQSLGKHIVSDIPCSSQVNKMLVL